MVSNGDCPATDGTAKQRRPWRAPFGLVVAAVTIVAGWPALTQGVASGDADGAMSTAAELTLTATAHQLGAYQSAIAVIARRAAAEEAGAAPTTTVPAPAAPTTTPPTQPPTPTTAAVAPAPAPAAPAPPPPVEAAPPPPATTAPAPLVEQAPPAATQPPPPPPPPPAPVAAPVPVAAAMTAGTDAAAEARFLDLVNGLRGSLGLGPVSSDGRLQGAARGWARGLADQGGLSHQDLNQFLDAWFTAGENVAFGPDADAVFNALVSSPRHYANMTRGDFSVVGIGAVMGADGRLWTSHVFAG